MEGSTAVVFDAHVYLCVDEVRGDVYGLLGVDEHILMVFGVVRGACGYAQHKLLGVGDLRHPGRR